MRQFMSLALASLLCVTLIGGQATAKETDVAVKDPENTIVIELKDGRVVIELRPDLAPKHVARIKELAREGFMTASSFTG